jgi:hypothetical protein
VEPRLLNPPHTCCDDEPWNNGYEALPDDERIVSLYTAMEAISTSSGQNDSGMFELNFRDERYLPFEYSGAVSRWRIELPPENNQFNTETVTDVILHLNYMDREGGTLLRKAANEVAQHHLPGAGVRIFDLTRDMADVWQRFTSHLLVANQPHELDVRLNQNMFPFITGNREPRVNHLELYFEAAGAEPSAEKIVELRIRRRAGYPRYQDDVQLINCVASTEWPGFYYGVLDRGLVPYVQNGSQDLGKLVFPPDLGEISQAYLFCGYEVVAKQASGKELVLKY